MKFLSHKMALKTHSLYSFLGPHLFLIGLFPFYIPVYLYKTGFSLALICFFISVTGTGFCISLYFWDRIFRQLQFRYMIVFSFCSEFMLLTLFFLEKNMSFILVSGFFNGVFNCCFWMIQRLLFLDTITDKNSGKKFGNFQIFVLIILKVGIFIGGIMLEKSGYLSVYIFSVGIVITISAFFLTGGRQIVLNKEIVSACPLSLRSLAGYKDYFNSKFVFAVDGIFLYLESYFWVISLFVIVQENFWKLGLLVIFLMVMFGSIFVMVKNRIDSLPSNKMFNIAVCLYSLSWMLRGVVSLKMDITILFLLLAVITFCTSIFRLAFNKRFFDIAKSATAHEYIFIKSYFSQFFLAVSAMAGFLLLRQGGMLDQLSSLYFAAALFSTIYFFYTQKKQ